MAVIPQTLDPIIVRAKFIVCLLLSIRASTEQAGESGVQLSVGAKMELMVGDQAAALATNFTACLGGGR